MTPSRSESSEVDYLHALVTAAIGRAERVAREDAAAGRRAWEEVGRIERSLAAILPADCDEGGLARRGEVVAWLEAGRRVEAGDALDRYRTDFAVEAVSAMEALIAEDDNRVASHYPWAARRAPVAATRAYAASTSHFGLFVRPRAA